MSLLQSAQPVSDEHSQPAGQLPEAFSTLFAKVSRESSVNFTGVVFSTVAGYAFRIYVSNQLGASALGLYGLGITLVGFLAIFAEMGLPLTAARFVSVYASSGETAKLRGILRRSTARIALASIILALGMAAARHWIADNVFHEPALAGYLPAFALLLPVMSLGTYFAQVLRGYHDITRQTIINRYLAFFLRVIVVVGLFAVGWQLWGYIAAELAGSLLALLLLAFFARRFTPRVVEQGKPERAGWDHDVKVMVWLTFAAGIIGYTSGRVGHVVIGIYLDAAQVGIYGAALTTAAYISLVLASINTIFGPVIASVYARHDMDMLGRLYRTVTRWVIYLSLPLCLVMVVFAAPLMRIFGPEFEAGALALIILAAGQAANVVTGPAGSLLIMTGRQHLDLYASLGSLPVLILLYVVLTPPLGIVGVAAANASRDILVNFARLVMVRRTLRVSPYDESLLRMLPALAASAVAILLVRLVPVTAAGWGIILALLAAVLGAAVLMAVALAFGFNADDRIILATVRKQIRSRLRFRKDGDHLG